VLNVVVGVALIPLLWLIRDALGRGGTLWAGVFTALSPLLAFYSRDYIHETLLIVFTFLFIAACWRYWRQPALRWALLGGLSVGLMQATKETFVLNLLAMMLASVVLWWWGGRSAVWKRCWSRRVVRHGLFAFGVWLGVVLLLFTSFGQYPSGPLDALRTYLPWLNRAGGGSPHIHSLWFYAERWFWWPGDFWMPWTELGLLGLAVVGAHAGFTARGLGDAPAGFVRWMALYTGILFVIYSLIPYKTPWCILGAGHGMVILAGVGLTVLWHRTWRVSYRLLLAGLTLLVLGHLSFQAWALSHSQVSSRGNPWAYADTVPDLRHLVDRIDALAASSSLGREMNVQVVCEGDDYWPLPYYLRRFDRVGWWAQQPPAPWARVVVMSSALGPAFETASGYINTGSFQLRYGVFLTCYCEPQLWEDFLQARESD
jgi:uncharacterized protein (TIGR03663 family)